MGVIVAHSQFFHSNDMVDSLQHVVTHYSNYSQLSLASMDFGGIVLPHLVGESSLYSESLGCLI